MHTVTGKEAKDLGTAFNATKGAFDNMKAKQQSNSIFGMVNGYKLGGFWVLTAVLLTFMVGMFIGMRF